MKKPLFQKTAPKHGSESGNVLFLILIAVALFAALSYAVTQSTRSGAGDASSETNLINSAQITQYPAGVRTAIMRMIIGGTDVTALEFNPPPYTGLTSNAVGVFHPSGGGATYESAAPDIMSAGTAGTWHFNGEFEIENINLSTGTSAAGNEIIAFLSGVTDSICIKINDELGITTADASGIPEYAITGAEYDEDMDNSYSIPASEETLDSELAGQPFGCFRDTTPNPDVNVYYHVLVER